MCIFYISRKQKNDKCLLGLRTILKIISYSSAYLPAKNNYYNILAIRNTCKIFVDDVAPIEPKVVYFILIFC